ncbi:MAG: SynChlorMet cassette protein ScmC [Syntrophales bacterium]|nr:SynChlorMet cassette protein ScmC [Syntrophales bacterium]
MPARRLDTAELTRMSESIAMKAAQVSRATWGLKLADGRDWAFSAEDTLRAWLGAFAAVLQLERTDRRAQGPFFMFRSEKTLPLFCGNHEASEFTSTLKQIDNDVWMCTLNGQPGKIEEIECMRETLRVLYHDAIMRGGIPCHGGLLDWEGRGILIAGASGTGKSTLCRRLTTSVTVLSDEETLIVRDAHGQYWGHPFPTWSRLIDDPETPRSWPVQKAIPLGAIFFVFPSSRDACIPIGAGEAAGRLTRLALEKSGRVKSIQEQDDLVDLKMRLFENACTIASRVPAARLKVSLKTDMEREFDQMCRGLLERPHPSSSGAESAENAGQRGKDRPRKKVEINPAHAISA